MTSEINTREIFSMSLEVGSAEEVKRAFNIDEITEILSQLEEDQKFSFEIICKEVGSSKQVSYKLGANSNDSNIWLKR